MNSSNDSASSKQQLSSTTGSSATAGGSSFLQRCNTYLLSETPPSRVPSQETRPEASGSHTREVRVTFTEGTEACLDAADADPGQFEVATGDE